MYTFINSSLLFNFAPLLNYRRLTYKCISTRKTISFQWNLNIYIMENLSHHLRSSARSRKISIISLICFEQIRGGASWMACADFAAQASRNFSRFHYSLVSRTFEFKGKSFKFNLDFHACKFTSLKRVNILAAAVPTIYGWIVFL